MGTVESSISDASGACSPPRTTIGWPSPRMRAKPLQSDCAEPRIRATIRSAAAKTSAISVCAAFVGLT